MLFLCILSAFLFNMRQQFVDANVLGSFRLEIISLLGIVFVYIIIIYLKPFRF